MEIILADFRATSGEHLIVNASLINAFALLNQEVILYASNGQVESQNELPITKDVKKIGFGNTYSRNRVRTFFERELLFIKRYISIRLRHKESSLIILNISPIAQAILAVCSFLARPKNKPIIIHHSELEILYGKGMSISKIAMIISRCLFTYSSQSRIVVSHNILNNISVRDRTFSKYLNAIEHPFHSSFCPSNEAVKPFRKREKRLNIGIPGSIRNDQKGLHQVLELIDLINKTESGQYLTFTFIGKSSTKIRLPEHPNIAAPFIDNKQPIPQKDYDALIQSSDVLLFMYEKDSYKFTASGAILDCLKYNTPALSLSNSLFNYYEKNRLFPGETKSDLYAIKKRIIELLNPENYELFIENSQDSIKRLKKQTSAVECRKVISRVLSDSISTKASVI